MVDQNSKYCTVCGELIDPNFKFCPECGSTVNKKIDRLVKVKSGKVDTDEVKSKVKQGKKKSERMTDAGPIEKKLSPIKLFYVLFSLVVVIGVILFTSGIFDKPSQQIQSDKSFEELHSGVDLKNLERINELENQLKVNPDEVKLLELAHLLNDSGLKERAIEKYKEYLKTNPKEADVLVDMGVCYFDLRNYAEAEKWMKEALIYNPQHQIAHLNLGVVTINSGKRDEALVWWKKAVAINPNTEVAKRAQELINSH